MVTRSWGISRWSCRERPSRNPPGSNSGVIARARAATAPTIPPRTSVSVTRSLYDSIQRGAVRPGDELRIESEVLEVRPSRSRPDQGLIKVRTTTLNQHDEAVQVIIANLVVPRRPTQRGEEANMSEHLDPAGARVSSKYRGTTAAAPTGD